MSTQPKYGGQWSPYNRPGGTPAPGAANLPQTPRPNWTYGGIHDPHGPIFEGPEGYVWQQRPDLRRCSIPERFAWYDWCAELADEHTNRLTLDELRQVHARLGSIIAEEEAKVAARGGG